MHHGMRHTARIHCMPRLHGWFILHASWYASHCTHTSHAVLAWMVHTPCIMHGVCHTARTHRMPRLHRWFTIYASWYASHLIILLLILAKERSYPVIYTLLVLNCIGIVRLLLLGEVPMLCFNVRLWVFYRHGCGCECENGCGCGRKQ
jgi:hypothetical protein